MKPIERLVNVANKKDKAELVIKNAKIFNGFSKTFKIADVAIDSGYIAGVGEYSGQNELDAKGALLTPGFIDGHVHIESGMASPLEFAKTLVANGTTTIIADPHEIANVAGIKGLEYLLKATDDLPISVYMMLPSCVPATPLEMGGASLNAEDLKPFLKHPRVLGLGEMMNYPGVLNNDPEVMAKLHMAENHIIDGHAPELMGTALNAYATAGIRSDHECTKPEEALARIENGIAVMLREGSAAKNLLSLLDVVNDNTAPFCFFATDDRHPEDLIEQGHINYLVKLASEDGRVSLENILNLASLNAARHFGLRELGAIAPGFKADLALFSDTKNWKPSHVWKAGKLVVENGEVLGAYQKVDESAIRNSVRLQPLTDDCLKVKATASKVRVIGLIPNQLLTEHLIMQLPSINGEFKALPEQDIIKIAVFERHRNSGNIGVGFIKGLGLKSGAIASTIAHDSHNLVVAGVTDADMLLAVAEIQRIGGGLAIVENGKVLASLALELGGLLSDQPMTEIKKQLALMQQTVRKLGLTEGHDPFMTLAFMSLPVIPYLKITENGLVDITTFSVVPTVVE
ncbi:adenine deaminase [Desulfovibrio litoralis]|uniref:Adenine deaminase n=1 Tax=Desulfovibrio litoralis DSM 11393 TaxID=1121455 RepID=A0A1M7TCK7_9BACT|nr:adenine deaminase [Desulfovibrio litoralis]SHN68470.1 Adenine deaminase [Desulfovibrio litoralis DSM 11393]